MTKRRAASPADRHVLPIDDLREHDETRTCWCTPTVEYRTEWGCALVIHNSMDGRELVEKHGLQ